MASLSTGRSKCPMMTKTILSSGRGSKRSLRRGRAVAGAEEIDAMGRERTANWSTGSPPCCSICSNGVFSPASEARAGARAFASERIRLRSYLRDNPSLKARLGHAFGEAYELAVILAARDAELPRERVSEDVALSRRAGGRRRLLALGGLFTATPLLRSCARPDRLAQSVARDLERERFPLIAIEEPLAALCSERVVPTDGRSMPPLRQSPCKSNGCPARGHEGLRRLMDIHQRRRVRRILKIGVLAVLRP